MNKTFSFLRIMAAVIVMLTALPDAADAQQFSACGLLVQDSGCVLFRTTVDPQAKYVLSTYAPFSPGDSVCVRGIVTLGCQSPCPGVVGCVQVDSITANAIPPASYAGCGLLFADGGCLVFAPGQDQGTHYALANTGNFGAGDTVWVSGLLDFGCNSPCSSAVGCIMNDSIISCAGEPPIQVPGRAVMKLVSSDSLNGILASSGIDAIDSITTQLTYLVAYADSVPVSQMLQLLQETPGVLFAEPEFQLGLPEVLQMSVSFPDEHPAAYIQGSSPENYYSQPANSSIDIDPAHVTSTGAGVKVAVIDNGVSFSHPLLQGSFASTGYDFVDNDFTPEEEPGPALGHGTFVAGLIKLTAPDCQLIPIRAFNGSGVGTSWEIAQSIYLAIAEGADVINMSFGFRENSLAVARACSTAVLNGITLVAAVGNDSSFIPLAPAMYDNVIAVAALDTNQHVAYFSNYGDYLDLCAPGVRLYSSLAGNYQWGTWGGTSFAAALVSGTAALVRGVDPGIDPLQMRARLQTTAVKEFGGIVVHPPDPHYGYGKVDALNAVLGTTQPNPNLHGDADSSGVIDVTDCVYLIHYIFDGGTPPHPLDRGDANCDEAVDIADVVMLIGYIFGSAPLPACP